MILTRDVCDGKKELYLNNARYPLEGSIGVDLECTFTKNESTKMKMCGFLVIYGRVCELEIM